MQFGSRTRGFQSWIGGSALVLFALIYCLSALLAPFWNDNDTWSNLLPVIHFRQSILDERSLPLTTDLWYGGREQWANPLWNFLYLPSTLIWLLTPLDWGTRLVFLGHLIFSLLAGRKLAALFLEREIERASAAVILTSPIMPALTAGHVEKVMSWGWILLAVCFLFDERLTTAQRGLRSGLCLGIVPLTGANYYALYGAILLVTLILSYRHLRFFVFFCLGSLIGLLHLPSVWHMIGHTRVHAKAYIETYAVTFPSMVSSLATGFSRPLSWETWTPVGIPMVILFGWILLQKAASRCSEKRNPFSPQERALLGSIFMFSLLASGLAYRGHNLFDLFRVPARALAFLGLGVTLFVLMNVRRMVDAGTIKPAALRLLLFISAVQIAASAWMIRPEGSLHGPYEPSVQRLARLLKADGAQSVWISTRDLGKMYIHAGLTQNYLALPNVYYGDMGQTIEISGGHCGYSFDHLLTFAPLEPWGYELSADTEWSSAHGQIPATRLHLLRQMSLGSDVIHIYRVVCPE